MEPKMIDEKKTGMQNFLDNLQKNQEEIERMKKFQNSREHKLNLIAKERENGLENCASAVICKIYRDALPVNDEYRNGYMSELNDGFISHIKKKNPKGVYAYITDSAKTGSIPAKLMLEEVTRIVDASCKKFYENLDEVDPEDIKIDTDSEEVKDEIEQVSAKMDYDQVSDIIENNVRATIQKEIENTKNEDQKIAELEEKLSENPDVQTESAIEMELAKAGIKKKVYEPSLFNGIMIRNVSVYSESGELDDEHVQKKAFLESVKEYTILETLSVLNMDKMKSADIRSLASQYAYGNI